MSIFANPLIVFTLVWGLPLIVGLNIPVAGYSLTIEDPIVYFLALNLFILVVVNLLVAFIFSKYPKNITLFHLSECKLSVITNYIVRMFYFWLIGYFFTILYSGGVPLLWIISGVDRTYVDFGMPTFSGLLNMYRAFIVTIVIYLLFVSKKKSKKLIFILVFLFFSCFFIELSRGNGTFLAAHAAGMFFMMQRLTLRISVVILILSIIFLSLGSFINAIRYGEGLSYLIEQAENYGMKQFTTNSFLVLIVPFLAYTTLPLINLNLKLSVLSDFIFEPYYIFQGVLPTILRELFFKPKDYGLLIDPAHNVSSFLDPIIRDFGGIFSLGFLVYFYFVIFVIYYAARKGNQICFFIYPAIYASCALSFFSMYFLLLVVLFYPIPAYLLVSRIRK